VEALSIETGLSSDYGPCPCCGDMSRKVSGYVYADNSAHAMYLVHWTLNQVLKHGAHFDIIIGRWGDGTTAADRSAVSLEYRITEKGPFLTVIDAHGRDHADGTLAKRALRRDDVIGKPLAKKVFAICDEIFLQDDRIAELHG
jgi:hypothetical protein